MTLQTEICSDSVTLYSYLQSGASWQRILPGWAGLRVINAPIKQKRHDLLDVEILLCSVPCYGRFTVTSSIEPTEFSVTGLSCCYKNIRIMHRVRELSAEKSLLTTSIHGINKRLGERLLAYLHRVISHDAAFHFHFKERKRIVIAGASGLIGRELASFFEAGGHEVVRLSRKRVLGHSFWDPDHHLVDESALEGADAIINLAGEPILGLWTEEKRVRILESRVKAQETLVNAVSKLHNPPPLYISSSAVGYYGSDDVIKDERSPLGEGFLANVCARWEEALEPLRETETKAAIMRIGIVLSTHGGALQSMLLPRQFGLAPYFGSGKQWMSVIAIDDLIGLIGHALFDQYPSICNAVCPQPIQQKDFMKLLGGWSVPIPKCFFSLFPHNMGKELFLASQRVVPDSVLSRGFSFSYPTAEACLHHLLP